MTRLGIKVRLGALTAVAAAIALGLAIVPGSASPAAAGTVVIPHQDKPTIVLVHGAWADASSWASVTSRLQRLGFPVVAPANPLRGLATDAATISDLLQTIHGPIVLVGHSYGGAVITNAAVGNANVKALVYVDAYVPDQGDTIFGLTGALPGSCVGPSAFNFVPFPGAPMGDFDTYLKTAADGTYPGFANCFANGLSNREAALLAASQRPAALNAGTDPSGPPAWKTIPSWDLVGTADHVIPPAEQLAMAHRANAHVSKVHAGHLSLISNPNAAVETILAAVDGTS